MLYLLSIRSVVRRFRATSSDEAAQARPRAATEAAKARPRAATEAAKARPEVQTRPRQLRRSCCTPRAADRPPHPLGCRRHGHVVDPVWTERVDDGVDHRRG